MLTAPITHGRKVLSDGKSYGIYMDLPDGPVPPEVAARLVSIAKLILQHAPKAKHAPAE